MTALLIILAIIILTYVERRIYLHFKQKGILGHYKGKEHYKNLKHPVYGFYYRLYVDFRDWE